MLANIFQTTVLGQQIKFKSAEIDAAYEVYRTYFLDEKIHDIIRNHKEEEYKPVFLRKLFAEVLGYTPSFDSLDDFNLRVEQKNEDDQKKADASLLVNNEVRGIIEIKDTRTIDLGRIQEQAFGYKNHHKNAIYIITSNFEKLRFYIDYAGEYLEWNLFTLSRENFGSLWVCLAWESIRFDVPKRLKTESITREEEITKDFYAHYKQFKNDLFANLIENNPAQDKLTLFMMAQKLLDRVLFILFAEDRGLLPPNTIAQLVITGWETICAELGDDYLLYDHLKKYFTYLDKGRSHKWWRIFAYNGGLFKTDKTLDDLKISDEVLRHHLWALCQYDFNSDVDVNILGHIFEHSLTEIEKVKNELSLPHERTSPKESKRKQDGIFYTPNYITRYIVDQTLGHLCREKKQELGIHDEWLNEAVREKDKRKKSQLADERKAVFDQYRSWLLSLTICDPACGSGAFLNATLDFLKAEHRTIDEMVTKMVKNPKILSAPDFNINNEILRNNLYGVDLNEEGVEITRLALWLHSAEPEHPLCFLDNNIKCGNSLVSDPAVSGSKAFDWHKEFPHIFEKGGFDVVIGNPPYVDSETMCKIDPEGRKYLTKEYSTAKGNWDLFVPFVEKATQLIRENSMAAMIVPNRLIAENYAEHIRALLSEKCLLAVVDYARVRVFEDADTYPCIFVLQNKDPAGSVAMTVMKSPDTPIFVNEIPSESLKTDLYWDKFFSPAGTVDLVKKISVHKTLSSYFEVRGAATVAEAYLLEKFIKEKSGRDKKFKKLINTGTIDRYTSLWGYSPIRYIKNSYLFPIIKDADIQNINPARMKQSASPKIIVAGMSLRIEAYLDDGSSIAGKSTTIILGEYEKLKYIIAILNSKLMSFWFSVNFNSLRMSKGYFNIGVNELSALPIAFSSKVTLLAAQTDRMLSLHGKLQKERQNFLELLSDRFDGLKITGKLERFEKMEFKHVMAELKKQKFDIPLHQTGEWRKIFNGSKGRVEAIHERIRKTDAKIDCLVYRLYNLTREEIAIVDPIKPPS